ncbi:MAG: hypothetical protein F6K10_43165, partial [Moorea sp. SIO2B7]|nr:hypothetical protein [Moorena sp. SIO2B7]
MNLEKRQELLEEAIQCVRYAKIELGEDSQETPETNTLKEQAIKLLESLGEERVSFAPKPDVYRLSEKDLKGAQEKLSPEIKAKMRHHHFYKIDIPITLKSSPEWAFTDLICEVVFCPGEEESGQVKQLPTIHALFPSDEWQEILKLEDYVTIGLDENLAFRAEVEKLEGKWKKLSSNAQAKLASKLGGSFQLVFGPFSYRIRKAKIKSRGIGNVQGSWELNGTEYVDEQDVKLGIILTVPKSRKQSVNVIAALEA